MFNVIIIIDRKKNWEKHQMERDGDCQRLLKELLLFSFVFADPVKNVQQFMIEFDSRFSLPI